MNLKHDLGSLAIAALVMAGLLAAAGCHGGSGAAASNCLSDTRLVDQHGDRISLASLKGKPLVVDFIYTSCSGECLMETMKLANVAERLGPDLGSKATIVSIDVDPEHDGPKQLLAYALKQGVDKKGWYFLTGGPGDINQALAGFNIDRQVMPDGSVGHVIEMMLIGADGRLVREYNGELVKAQDIVDDLRKTLNQG